VLLYPEIRKQNLTLGFYVHAKLLLAAKDKRLLEDTVIDHSFIYPV